MMPQPRISIFAAPGTLDQSQVQYWRDEGFAADLNELSELSQVSSALDALQKEGSKYGIIAYGDAASATKRFFSESLKDNANVPCAVIFYYGKHSSVDPIPGALSKTSLRHDVASDEDEWCRTYTYPEASRGFAQKHHANYDQVAERLSWTRSLQHMRDKFGVPPPDLEKIWEHHLELEFQTKDAAATMRTMVAEPYVNHVPTLTGGIGAKDLRRFYADFFIPNNPADTRVRLLSRTVGTDRVVDEMLFTFTHTLEIPWMLPGVAPTGKAVEVALVSVVCIRGGKLYHEHIYWDQATVLVQIGMLDPMLVPKGIEARRIPVVDAWGARKVMDEGCVSSNELIPGW